MPFQPTHEPSQPVFVIAELGINHNGDLDTALRMIDMAADCGCDAVKFQKRDVDVVYSKAELASPRQSPFGITFGDQKRGLELSKSAYDEINSYCRRLPIEWFASAWDLNSLKFLAQYDLPYNKVASALITNEHFLRCVAAQGKLTFISTGMCGSYKPVDRAALIFRQAKCPFVLMHCIATYPADEGHLNLRNIPVMRAMFECPVGYSGHEASVSPSLVAASLGACAIERHITLDRTMYGTDQPASLEEHGLRTLVQQLRKLPAMLGSDVKQLQPGEDAVAKKLRYWER